MDSKLLTYVVVGALVYLALQARQVFAAPSGVAVDPTTGVPVTPDWLPPIYSIPRTAVPPSTNGIAPILDYPDYGLRHPYPYQITEVLQ